jgi:hypothetical protein
MSYCVCRMAYDATLTHATHAAGGGDGTPSPSGAPDVPHPTDGGRPLTRDVVVRAVLKHAAKAKGGRQPTSTKGEGLGFRVGFRV